MTENLGDDIQRRALGEHQRGAGVPQLVRVPMIWPGRLALKIGVLAARLIELLDDALARLSLLCRTDSPSLTCCAELVETR